MIISAKEAQENMDYFNSRNETYEKTEKEISELINVKSLQGENQLIYLCDFNTVRGSIKSDMESLGYSVEIIYEKTNTNIGFLVILW